MKPPKEAKTEENQTNYEMQENEAMYENEAMRVNEAMPAYDRSGYYKYEDYCAWEDDKRWELIDGKPHLMSAPSENHQLLLVELVRQFANFLKGKKCRVFAAPFDVRLNHDTLDDTVVQPDVLVVCDREKTADGKALKGAPDLAIEILSPSNPKHDTLVKYKKYMESGVREYWTVDPQSKTVNVNILVDGKYITRHHSETDQVAVHVLDDCIIDLKEVFGEMV